MKSLHVLLALSVCAALLAAGCTNVATDGSQEKPFWAKETTAPPATPTQTLDNKYVSPATPYPTTTTPSIPPTQQLSAVTPAPPAYLEVLHEKVVLNSSHPASAWTINVTKAPLLLDISIQPKMVTRTIVYDSSYGSHDEETKSVTTISDKCRLEVTVRDENGNIVLQDGFAGLYSVDTSKQLRVMSPGKYQLDIRGADVTIDLSAKIGQTEQTSENV